MRRVLVFLALCAAPLPAAALTSARVGFVADASAGVQGAISPGGVGGAWQADLGVWRGNYDDAYSLGRGFGLTAGIRQDLARGGPTTAAVVDLRRMIDIIAVGWHVFAGGGPVLGSELRGLVEAGVGVKLRTRYTGPWLGPLLRIQGGVELGQGDVSGRILATLGFETAAPFRKHE
jgi:hypothetical protein